MKFTFITSFYKTYNNIDAQYESIKNQTYTNWEWVVTDDFSDDGSREKLIDIASKDRKVKFVEQSKFIKINREEFISLLGNPSWCFSDDMEHLLKNGVNHRKTKAPISCFGEVAALFSCNQYRGACGTFRIG